MDVRGMVIGMLNAGVSKAKAAREVGVSPRTVHTWCKLWKETGNVPKAKKPPGRDSKVSLSNLRLIKRALDEDPFLTAVDIMRDNPSLHHLSLSTVRLAIRKTLGFFYRRAAKKPPLTPRMLEDRLRFCDRYEGWSEQQWGQVLFTDESTFRIGKKGCHKRAFVRRRSGSHRYAIKFVNTPFRISQAVRVWASFSAESAPELVVLDKNEMMRTERYCEVLRNNVLPSMRQSNLQYLLADKIITCLN